MSTTRLEKRMSVTFLRASLLVAVSVLLAIFR